jgi:DNA-binding response OmpR family regulator
MPDAHTQALAIPLPGTPRPLTGVTILLVEDSRYASEAVRLLGLRSGARLRRADSLRAAERHLAVYRPTVALIDLGLPDGSGADLIRRLGRALPRLPAILGTSGDDGAREEAMEAGADGFVAKPVTSLAAFEAAVLGALNRNGGTPALRPVTGEAIVPDRLAYHDDLVAISDLLSDGLEGRSVAYAAQFLAGVARSADDSPLADAALALSARVASGGPTGADVARIAGLVAARLNRSATA